MKKIVSFGNLLIIPDQPPKVVRRSAPWHDHAAGNVQFQSFERPAPTAYVRMITRLINLTNYSWFVGPFESIAQADAFLASISTWKSPAGRAGDIGEWVNFIFRPAVFDKCTADQFPFWPP
jgi:hypothetical protein